MKQILQKVLAQRNLLREANAASVLFECKKFLQLHIPHDISFSIVSWKRGVIRISVENSTGAQLVFQQSNSLMNYLEEKFPEFHFREIRTEIRRF